MRGEEVEVKMRKALEIMKNSVKEPLIQPVKSVGGLIVGEAKKLGGNNCQMGNLSVELCCQKL